MNKINNKKRQVVGLPSKEHIHHFDQDFPLCFREGGNNPPIWWKSLGIETKLIGLSLINQSHAILVRPDSDITSVLDLRSRRLSVPVFNVDRVDFWNSMVKRGYKTILEAYGIREDEVKYKEFTID